MNLAALHWAVRCASAHTHEHATQETPQLSTAWRAAGTTVISTNTLTAVAIRQGFDPSDCLGLASPFVYPSICLGAPSPTLHFSSAAAPAVAVHSSSSSEQPSQQQHAPWLPWPASAGPWPSCRCL